MNGEKYLPGLIVRAATMDDIPALTELHLTSFRPEEHVLVMLGREYVRATYRWLLTSRNCYCLVADLNGRIIGLVGVCDGPYTRPMFLACLPEFVKSLLRSPQLLLQKKLWLRVLRHAEDSQIGREIAAHPDIAQITIVAVDAACRGLGVFPALIAAVQICSTSRGSRAIQSGVYKFNHPSRRAFVKAGWVETQELETGDTVFFLYYIDPHLPDDLGISLAIYEGGVPNER